VWPVARDTSLRSVAAIRNMRYAREAKVALTAVRSASRAALSLQREIAASKAAYQKADYSGTGMGTFSPVTAADFMVQVCLIGCLANAFPQDRFIAEETGTELLAAGAATRAAVMNAVATHADIPIPSEADALATLDLGQTGAIDGWSRTGRTWVIDPVDGTKGFLRGDQFAIALSLLDGGEPVLGLLGCPNLGDEGALFFAARGGGARWGTTHGTGSDLFGPAGPEAADIFDQATPLRVSNPPSGGLVRCEAFESSHTNFAAAAAIGERLGISTAPIRMDGQCKYGLIARGECHIFTRLPGAGYVERIWDHAAGALVVEEAGGRVSDLEGRRLDFSGGAKLSPSVQGIVATNGAVHDELLDALAGAR